MDNVNFLQRMSEFDFSSPIDVIIIFEDSDDEESFKNAPRERESMKDCNKNNQTSQSENECLDMNKVSENNNNIEDINKSIYLNNSTDNYEKNTVYRDNSKKNAEQMQSGKTIQETEHLESNLSIREENCEDTNINGDSEPITHQIYDDEPVNTFVEDLLNQISEHLLVIMKSFYHYGVKRNTCNRLFTVDIKKRENVYRLIKSHFFELSYATVKSILLPQENNISFINKFLDNTVIMANKKHLNWKLQRRHLQPFLNELMLWVKQRKAYNKQNCNQHTNKNEILIQHLSKPFNPPNSKDAPHSNYTTCPNVEKKLCIFNSGTPGSEISINVDADTYIHCTQTQYPNCTEGPGNQNNYMSSNESATRKLPSYECHINNFQKNNINYYRQPPPYSIPPKSKKNNHNQNHVIVNPIPNYHTIAPPHQSNQNIRHNNQNYQSYVHYVNTNQISPPDSKYVNSSVQHNMNNNNQMNRTQIEKEITIQPVITNVSSLNSKACMSISVRCCMCGKSTTATCSYTSPCRPAYCSYLCQELDSQVHKLPFSNT